MRLRHDDFERLNGRYKHGRFYPRCGYCWRLYDPHDRHEARRHQHGRCAPQPVRSDIGRELAGWLLIAVIVVLLLLAHTH